MFTFHFLVQFADSQSQKEITLHGDCKDSLQWMISSLELGNHLSVIKHWVAS
ncbi:hypothetical protein [Marinospirillum perlucidum]|uniref:hypothetical protein n=1 Tax=Marinospirillum perlucidum TaxID=1982602 RepID=UPI0013902E93|nr:hypothetical protein [Marinospirillum perlucidum]